MLEEQNGEVMSAAGALPWRPSPSLPQQRSPGDTLAVPAAWRRTGTSNTLGVAVGYVTSRRSVRCRFADRSLQPSC